MPGCCAVTCYSVPTLPISSPVPVAKDRVPFSRSADVPSALAGGSRRLRMWLSGRRAIAIGSNTHARNGAIVRQRHVVTVVQVRASDECGNNVSLLRVCGGLWGGERALRVIT